MRIDGRYIATVTALALAYFAAARSFHPELAHGGRYGAGHRGAGRGAPWRKVWAESERGVGTTFHVTLPTSIDMRKG
jgi:hypothetical protein